MSRITGPNITGGKGPFTVAISGSTLPVGTIIGVSGRALVVSGPDEADGTYTFTATITDTATGRTLVSAQSVAVGILPQPTDYDSLVTYLGATLYAKLNDSGSTIVDSAGGSSGVWNSGPDAPHSAALFAANDYSAYSSFDSAQFADRADFDASTFSAVIWWKGNWPAAVGLMGRVNSWSLYVSAGHLNAFIFDGLGANRAIGGYGPAINDDAPHVLGIVYDGENISLYVDGSNVVTTAYSGTFVPGANANTMNISRDGHGNDGIRYYSNAAYFPNIVLTDDNMADLYDARNTPTP